MPDWITDPLIFIRRHQSRAILYVTLFGVSSAIFQVLLPIGMIFIFISFAYILRGWCVVVWRDPRIFAPKMNVEATWLNLVGFVTYTWLLLSAFLAPAFTLFLLAFFTVSKDSIWANFGIVVGVPGLVFGLFAIFFSATLLTLPGCALGYHVRERFGSTI